MRGPPRAGPAYHLHGACRGHQQSESRCVLPLSRDAGTGYAGLCVCAQICVLVCGGTFSLACAYEPAHMCALVCLPFVFACACLQWVCMSPHLRTRISVFFRCASTHVCWSRCMCGWVGATACACACVLFMCVFRLPVCLRCAQCKSFHAAACVRVVSIGMLGLGLDRRNITSYSGHPSTLPHFPSAKPPSAFAF